MAIARSHCIAPVCAGARAAALAAVLILSDGIASPLVAADSSAQTFADDGAVADSFAPDNFIRITEYGEGVSKRIKLGLDKAVVVDLPVDAHDILIANPAKADAVTRSSRRIYMFGKEIGETNIFVFGPDGEEIVSLELSVERDITGLEAQLARFIKDSDIQVEIISDNIVLTGRVRTPLDAEQASRIAQAFVAGGEATTRNITAQGNNGDAAIFAEDRQRSQIINLITIDGEDQVTLKVTVAEVSRQVLKQLGFNTFATLTGNDASGVFRSNLPANLGKPAITSNGGAFFGRFGSFSLESYLTAMERAGVMRTLAEPSLTAISGEDASFFVGGEFSLVTGQDIEPADENNPATLSYDIERIEYGIRLNFVPVVLSPGRISLRVRTEVSEPTFEDSVALSAGLDTQGATFLSLRQREAETSVELPSGGSIVIAGLVRDDIRQAVSGYPGLSKVPVLGTLFRSKDFQRNETELVIIATPFLVKPVARNALSRPDDGFNPAADGASFFLGRVNRIYGRMETELPDGRYHGAVGFIYK